MKKIILILSLINIIVLTTGCWDLREINELGLVTAVAIDKGEGANKYSVTVQIANPSIENKSTDSKSGEKSTAKSPVWTGTEEGDSIFDAARKLAAISSRRIMWAHNNVVLVGEALAREGIIPVVDYFTHNPELRMKTVVVVAKGDAKRYVAANAGMDSPSGTSFILLESYQSLTATSTESHMLKVSADLKNKYGNPLITSISLKKAVIQSGESGNNEDNSETIDMAGTAVFKKDKLIGWLSPEETRGTSWILNETRDTVMTVIDPEHGNKKRICGNRRCEGKNKIGDS